MAQVMKAKLRRFGEDFVLSIPKADLDRLGLKVGDEPNINVKAQPPWNVPGTKR